MLMTGHVLCPLLPALPLRLARTLRGWTYKGMWPSRFAFVHMGVSVCVCGTAVIL